jgi:hypothetical protein
MTSDQTEQVQACRAWFDQQYAGDPRFAVASRHDRSDGSMLATRWASRDNPRVWFEVAIRPFIPQIRVGILTDDRWKSEDFEEKIEESGDTMREFVEMGFEEAGLEWINPPVEHFREEMKYFYFATALDLNSVGQLSDQAVRTKARQMLEGYHKAFGPFLAA